MIRRYQQSESNRWWSRGIQLYPAVVSLCLLLLVPFGNASIVRAATKPLIWMGATVGYSGYYKLEDWVPITLSIHHVGRATPANLVVKVNQRFANGRRADGKLQWSVKLPKDGWITEQISVPGSMLNQGASVDLVAGDETLDTVTLSGNAVSRVSLVAVVTDSPQDTQFLAGSSSSSMPVLPVAVNPTAIPNSVDLLSGLSAVVITVPTLASLTKSQQSALHTWVELGGLLVVSGVGRSLSAWPRMPLSEGTSRMVSAQPLAEFASETSIARGVEVSAAGISGSATLWAGTNQTPLLASESVGRGQIWQTAFSPMDPSLLGWGGDAQMWTSIFNDGTNVGTSGIPSLFTTSGALSLTSVGDALAPLRVPSLSLFGIVFAAYILVAGPATFLLLRRWRKQTWAWAALPLLSGVTTVGIYVFGGSERPDGLLVNGVGVMDLTGTGSALSYAAEAVMSPSAANLHFRAPKGNLVMPMSVDDQPLTDSIVNFGDQSVTTFKNVPRWHPRYLFTVGTERSVGTLGANLSETYGILFGNVVNRTPYTLDDVAVVWGGTIVHLGTMKPGQQKSISPGEETQTSAWISDYGTYNRALTHGIGRALGAYLALLPNAAQDSGRSSEQAMLIATTQAHTPQLPVPRGGQSVASDKTLVLVRQFLNVTDLAGGN